MVCDILKAFNCLNRQVIHKLGMKGGMPTPILTAWAGSLKSLRRQVQISGYLYGEQHSSTTGYPEGDPLSVTALFILVWNFGWTLSEQFQDVEFRAYADNLELVSHHHRDWLQHSIHWSFSPNSHVWNWFLKNPGVGRTPLTPACIWQESYKLTVASFRNLCRKETWGHQ